LRQAHLKLVALLLILPAALIAYRVLHLGYPFLPTIPGRAFKVLFEAAVRGTAGQETEIGLALPRDHAGLTVTEEQVESGPLSFVILSQEWGRQGVWSGQLGNEEALISYGATMVRWPDFQTKPEGPSLGAYLDLKEPGERVLARRMTAKWRGLDPQSRLRAILEAVSGSRVGAEPPPQDLESWNELAKRRGRLTATLILLRGAELPARLVEGLKLSGSVETSTSQWLEVWTGSSWERVDPESLALIPPSITTIPLRRDGGSTLDVSHGEISQVCWTVTRERLSGWRVHFERIRTSPHPLDRWSLFRLPERFQETFRILLLVPLGALMICVLRNMVGLPTFGIFMPVLMALAFRSTGLVYGLILFGAVVLAGYLIRRFLEGLRLLLVPRLSVILSVVILMFTVVALLGNRLGQRELMAVGLIPFVILTMTIERLFVIAEEAGARNALRTAAGSAAVASVTYQLLDWDPLQLTFFVYPELLLVVAALQVLVGRYTGYRLSELLRFRRLGGPR